MASRSLIELRSFKLDQAENTYCSLDDTLHMQLEYSVVDSVCNPMWSVTFEADIAHKRIVVPLLPPTPCSQVTVPDTSSSFMNHTPSGDITALHSEGLYQLDVYLAKIDLSGVEEKYMQQVGLLSLHLFSGNRRVDSVNLVVQVKKDAYGGMKWLIMSPLV